MNTQPYSGMLYPPATQEAVGNRTFSQYFRRRSAAPGSAQVSKAIKEWLANVPLAVFCLDHTPVTTSTASDLTQDLVAIGSVNEGVAFSFATDICHMKELRNGQA